MNIKCQSRSRTKLAIAVAMTIAGISPGHAFAKQTDAIIGTGADAIIGTGKNRASAIIGTGADAIIGTGRAKASSSDAIIGTGKNRTRAIIGTGADAIIGTGADAIIGTGADAIIGTGADAIIGTGRAKASSSDAIIGTGKNRTRAIIGTGADAIIGTGADAIIGTGADAIIGTGADAIIGTGRAKASSSDAIIGTGKPTILHYGPVDSVDLSAGTIRSLGKAFSVPGADKLSALMASGRQVAVFVVGKVGADGRITGAKMRVAASDYVAGATKVVLVGRVAKADASTGTFTIGTAVVDYTGADGAAPVKGQFVIVTGTQPTRDGTVLAERLTSK